MICELEVSVEKQFPKELRLVREFFFQEGRQNDNKA